MSIMAGYRSLGIKGTAFVACVVSVCLSAFYQGSVIVQRLKAGDMDGVTQAVEGLVYVVAAYACCLVLGTILGFEHRVRR